jgi:hypothetical protein
MESDCQGESALSVSYGSRFWVLRCWVLFWVRGFWVRFLGSAVLRFCGSAVLGLSRLRPTFAPGRACSEIGLQVGGRTDCAIGELDHFRELVVGDLPLILRVQKLIPYFTQGSPRVIEKSVKFFGIESIEPLRHVIRPRPGRTSDVLAEFAILRGRYR